MEYFKLIVNGKLQHDYLFNANQDSLYAMEIAEQLEQDCPEITRVELALIEEPNERQETGRPLAPAAWSKDDGDLYSRICFVDSHLG